MKTKQRAYAEEMLSHYLECAYWADKPEDCDAWEFDIGSEENALADCMRFSGIAWELIKDNDPAQVGHDFWLTRNHHGAGFWDRPEIYGGEENAEKLTEISQTFNDVSVHEFNGKLLIE
jgi:hypothetical protein